MLPIPTTISKNGQFLETLHSQEICEKVAKVNGEYFVGIQHLVICEVTANAKLKFSTNVGNLETIRFPVGIPTTCIDGYLKKNIRCSSCSRGSKGEIMYVKIQVKHVQQSLLTS